MPNERQWAVFTASDNLLFTTDEPEVAKRSSLMGLTVFDHRLRSNIKVAKPDVSDMTDLLTGETGFGEFIP